MKTNTEEEIVIEDYDEAKQLNIANLPDDCIEYAFEFLSTKDLLTTRAINTNFKRLAKRILLRTNRQIIVTILDTNFSKIINFPDSIKTNRTIFNENTIEDLELFATNFKNVIHQKIEQSNLFSSDNPEEIKQLRNNIIINFVNQNDNFSRQTIAYLNNTKMNYRTVQSIMHYVFNKIKIEKQSIQKTLHKKIFTFTCIGFTCFIYTVITIILWIIFMIYLFKK